MVVLTDEKKSKVLTGNIQENLSKPFPMVYLKLKSPRWSGKTMHWSKTLKQVG